MNFRFLSSTHIHLAFVKSLGHSLPTSSFLSSPTANARKFKSVSRPFQHKRHLHSSLMLRQADSDERENAFWQSNRAAGELEDLKLETPDKIPYKKGQYITDYITKEEAKRYMFPLFMRGWRIEIGKNEGPGPYATPYLASQLVLASTQKAELIFAFLVSLEKQEKHHIRSHIGEGSQPVLSIRLHTHTARAMLDAVPGMEGYELTEPGITLRDVRYAVLLEQELLRSKFLSVPECRFEYSDKEIFSLIMKKHMEWDLLMSLYPWKIEED